MTNKTMLSVDRELLVDIYNHHATTTKHCDKLRALLDKPIEVTSEDVLRWMGEHAAAHHQGEPVAWTVRRPDGTITCFADEADRWPDTLIDGYVVSPLYAEQPAPIGLTVWFGSMPESNGKSNWTAILHRKADSEFPLRALSGGITIDRSEYHDRVRYEADRMRYLIGELTEEPDILAYDEKMHSGYVKPEQPAPVAARYRYRFDSDKGSMVGDGRGDWAYVGDSAPDFGTTSDKYKAEPVAVVMPFAEKVISKLRRFEECAGDSQDVDIGRKWFDVLTDLGLLERVQRSPAYWEMTQQGEEALESARLNGVKP